MERRAFLTLIAAAPIAALAPLPKVLAEMRDAQTGIAIRFVSAYKPDPDEFRRTADWLWVNSAPDGPWPGRFDHLAR